MNRAGKELFCPFFKRAGLLCISDAETGSLPLRFMQMTGSLCMVWILIRAMLRLRGLIFVRRGCMAMCLSIRFLAVSFLISTIWLILSFPKGSAWCRWLR